MIECTDHCRIVNESLNGSRQVDDQVFCSLAVLSERLERLRGLSEGFEGISFSPEVEVLKKQKSVVAAV
jgi:hypothetical protein